MGIDGLEGIGAGHVLGRRSSRSPHVDGDVEMARVVVTGTMKTGFAGVEGTGRSFRIDHA